MSLLRSFRAWLLAAVAVAALVLVNAPATDSTAARVAHLESLVRCPSCENISVAESNATSAVAVRALINREVRAGKSDTEILTGLESTYGTAIILSPPARGWGVVLWLAPVGVMVGLAAWWILRRRA